jgi:hypothetical protein
MNNVSGDLFALYVAPVILTSLRHPKELPAMKFIVSGFSKQQLRAMQNSANDADYVLVPIARALRSSGATRRQIVVSLTQAAKRLLMCGAIDADVKVKGALLSRQARRIAQSLAAEACIK